MFDFVSITIYAKNAIYYNCTTKCTVTRQHKQYKNLKFTLGCVISQFKIIRL